MNKEQARKNAANRAEKPATSPGLESHFTISSLANIFAQRSEEPRVKKLFCDVAKLRAWQTEAHATNKIQDAMTKLGSDWNVPQKAAGKKRPPSEIAADLERELVAFAKRLWTKKRPFSSIQSAVKPLPDNTLLEITKRRRKNSDKSTDLSIALRLKGLLVPVQTSAERSQRPLRSRCIYSLAWATDIVELLDLHAIEK